MVQRRYGNKGVKNMISFLCLMAGAMVGVMITSIFQANRNIEDREKLKSAIRLKDYYKDKCREMQEIIRREDNYGK